MTDAQEYTVNYFKAGTYQDNFGNTWCEAAFAGVSEPVRWVVKDPTKIHEGQVVYGHIEDATSKAGKPYLRFKTDKREDAPQATAHNTTEKKGWKSDEDYYGAKDSGIKAQFAIKAAIAFSGPDTPIKDIEATAKTFYDMIERVKGGNTPVEAVQETFKDVVIEPTDEPFNLNDIPF